MASAKQKAAQANFKKIIAKKAGKKVAPVKAAKKATKKK